MRRQHTYPPKLQERGNKYDVDALDALEIPRLGIELNFGWGLSYLVGDVDGVVVIPRHLAVEVTSDSVEQEEMEGDIIQKIADGAPLRGIYPPNAETKEAYMAWKRRQD